MTGPMTGLETGTLDALVLVLTLLSPVLGYFVTKTGSKLLQFVRAMFDMAKAQFQRDRALSAGAVPKPAEEPRV